MAQATDPVLNHILEPLARHYADHDVTEIRMNRPGVIILEKRGSQKIRVEDPELTLHALKKACKSLANSMGLKFNANTEPNLSTVLPGGHRFECLIGHSAADGLSLSIRCKHKVKLSWPEMGIAGDLLSYLQAIMLESRNIMISGSTSTGKTTLINNLLDFLPEDKRVVTVEDTPELDVSRFWDRSSLLAARDESANKKLRDYRQLADHIRRITPDCIIFGEISTSNAFAALDALNSGITGFMCTIHAESPHQLLHRKFDQNIAFAGKPMPRVGEYLCELVDVIIQIKRDDQGHRKISDIYEPRKERFVLEKGQPTEALALALEEMQS